MMTMTWSRTADHYVLVKNKSMDNGCELLGLHIKLYTQSRNRFLVKGFTYQFNT